MPLLRIALASLANRRFIAVLTVLTIALSVALLLSVERLRSETRASFASTVSGTDLIVGARTGSLNLLLYSVFRIGNATNNIRWQSYEMLAEHPQVKWAVPISLGDSHKGFRVLGTTPEYFQQYRYARQQPLSFSQGRAFAEDPFEVVLGAAVAKQLGYQLGQNLTLAHGVARVSLVQHDDKPFEVVGILAPTGTPVDQSLHISLAGMEALHLDWQNGMPGHANQRISAEQIRQCQSHESCAAALQPKAITAILLGLNSRIAAFAVQREVNQYSYEPLQAILPGVALQELWSLMSMAEQALLLISFCVVLTGLIGMLTAILASQNERRREMAILRSVGARPSHLAGLLMLEVGVLMLAGLLLGVLFSYLGTLLAAPWLQAQYGLQLTLAAPNLSELKLLAGIFCAGLGIGLLPAIRAYRQSLADGLSIRM